MKTPLLAHDLYIIFYRAFAQLKSDAMKTKLSFIWWFLEPTLMMLIYFLVFGIILGRYGVEWIPALLLGLIVWQWFVQSFKKAANSINSNFKMLTLFKVKAVILPAIPIVVETLKSSVVIGIFIFLLITLGYRFNPNYLYLPLLFFTELTLIFGLSILFATIIPFLPDVSKLLSPVLRVFTYISGILYPLSEVPEKYQDLFLMNPIAFLVESYRGIVISNSAPNLEHLALLLAISIVILLISLWLIFLLNAKFPRLLIER